MVHVLVAGESRYLVLQLSRALPSLPTCSNAELPRGLIHAQTGDGRSYTLARTGKRAHISLVLPSSTVQGQHAVDNCLSSCTAPNSRMGLTLVGACACKTREERHPHAVNVQRMPAERSSRQVHMQVPSRSRMLPPQPTACRLRQCRLHHDSDAREASCSRTQGSQRYHANALLTYTSWSSTSTLAL